MATPNPQALDTLKPVVAFEGNDKGAAAGIDRTAKMFIGGKQTRPDSAIPTVNGPEGDLLGHVGVGSPGRP